MYDLNDLEKKWISYKRQKYKKFGTLAISFVVVSAVSFGIAYAIFAPKNTAQTQSEANLTAQNNATKQVEVNQTQPLQPLSNFASYQTQPIQKEIVIISPDEKKDEFKSYQPTEQNKTVAQQPTKQPQQQTIQSKQQHTPPKITIETKSADQIDLLASRYTKNPEASTAISLSEIFYKQGNYPKALKWAINANNLDPKTEKSWILFAKSSYKLGKKQDAVNALENFANTNNSEAVRATINQIKNNEL